MLLCCLVLAYALLQYRTYVFFFHITGSSSPTAAKGKLEMRDKLDLGDTDSIGMRDKFDLGDTDSIGMPNFRAVRLKTKGRMAKILR